jgi:hypothetical protein
MWKSLNNCWVYWVLCGLITFQKMLGCIWFASAHPSSLCLHRFQYFCKRSQIQDRFYIRKNVCSFLHAGMIDSGWGGGRFSAPIQTSPRVHTASCTVGNGSLPVGVKRPWLGIDHLPPSSAAVKERGGLYLYSSWGPSWPVLGWTLP